MNLPAVCHRPTEEYIVPLSERNVAVRIKTAQKDIRSCQLHYWKRDMPQETSSFSMEFSCAVREATNDYFEGVIALPHTVYYLKYYFELHGNDGSIYYLSACGATSEKPTSRFFDFLYANRGDIRNTPGWAKHLIYYQIFPERFCNGDTSNDPPDVVSWGNSPTRYNHMGGDLQGISSKIPYLSELGINCLYLTPVFHASFNHKYGTTDYFSIDEQFGTLEDLKELVDKCHSHGIRILLDGVFNHCGYYFPPFQDVLESGELSKYRDWFFFDGFPGTTEPPNYACVGDYKWMPKLNMDNYELQDYFIQVGKYWIEQAGIDGWRLDVADEVEGRFWERFRYELKRNFPNILLLGETWGDGGKLLQGNRLDSVMNYLFKDAVTEWIAKKRITASELDHQLNHILAVYPFGLAHQMYNPLDSHDTARLLFEAGENIHLLKLAAGLQFTFVGCPAIYYGDEIGLSGDNDPDCRRAMPWSQEEQNSALFAWYQQLGVIRKTYPVFCKGEYRTVICDDDKNIFGFVRYDSDTEAYMAINRSEEAVNVTIPILKQGGVYRDGITGESFETIPVDSGDCFYNDDINPYQHKLLVSMPKLSIRIILSNGGKENENQ